MTRTRAGRSAALAVGNRQLHADASPSPGAIAGLDLPPMGFDDPLGDGEAEPGASLSPSEERLEHPLQVFLAKARTLVAHQTAEPVSQGRCETLDLDPHRPVLRAEVDGVLHEVGEHL